MSASGSSPPRVTAVVLGMHRSGTSVLAGMLHRLGVNMGTGQRGDAWIGKHWSNPQGHFENPRFVDLDRRILGLGVSEIKVPPFWDQIAARRTLFSAQVGRLVRTSEAPQWGFKDPWAVLAIEAYLPFLHKPRFVLCHRPADEIARSMERRDGVPASETVGLVELFERRLSAFRADHPDFSYGSFELKSVNQDPMGTVRQLVKFLALEPNEAQERFAAALVLPEPELRREARRLAARELGQFYGYVGWLLRRDLPLGGGRVREDLFHSIPREFVQTFKAAL